jgi:hypothetical protein
MFLWPDTVAFVLLAAMPGGDVSAAGSSALAAPPTAEMVQVLLAGKAGVPEGFDPAALFSLGDFLYAVGPRQKPSIHYFHRDTSSGSLAYAGSVGVTKTDCWDSSTSLVGGRLYVLLTRPGDNTLAWRDLDAKTGKAVEKGVTPKLAWTDRPGHTEPVAWTKMLVSSSDGKSIYVTTERAILRFKIAADGEPVPAGQLTGDGIGEYIFAAPDGKWLYTMTHKPVPAIACIQCQPDGQITLTNIVKLDPK